jgi:hypothetical protein
LGKKNGGIKWIENWKVKQRCGIFCACISIEKKQYTL